MQRRVIAQNKVVAEYDGENVVIKSEMSGHMRTYVLSEHRLTVTIRGRTEEIPLPWKSAAVAA